MKLWNPLGFPYIKNMLKDHLFKTTGFSALKSSPDFRETGLWLETIGFFPIFSEAIVRTMVMLITMMITIMKMTM